MSRSNSESILDGVHDGYSEEKLNNIERDTVITVQEERKNNFESVNLNETKSHTEDRLKNEILNGEHVMKIVQKDCNTVKVWECSVCNKVFKHQYTLLRHIPIHTDERKFKCTDCGKAFRQKSTLSQHQVIHADTRPFVCGFCKKTFNRMSSLKSHRVTHTDKKQQKCSSCDKSFHQKGNLKNHTFTHLEERPYKRVILGKGFNQKCNLMNHTQHSHKNITSFLCLKCNKTFPEKYILRAHEEYAHGIKYNGGMLIHCKMTQENSEITLKHFEDNKSYNSEENKQETKVIRVMKTTESEPIDINNSSPSSDPQSKQYADLEKEENISAICPSVIIDPIYSKAMLSAKHHGQTPIVLLKTAKGESVLVKVKDAANNKQMLVPTTADDLKSSGTITSFASFTTAFPSFTEINAIHIKVPIVATMVQRLSTNGHLSIEAEVSPENHDNDLENVTLLKQNKCHDVYNKLYSSVHVVPHNATLTCHLAFNETKSHKKSNILIESSCQVENNTGESSFTCVTDSPLSKSSSEFLINEDISFVQTFPSIDQNVQSSLHSIDPQNLHQVICVQIENGENEPCKCNFVSSSNTPHTQNDEICNSKIIQSVEYNTNEEGNNFVISSSNKIMLLEYDTDNSLQHIVYAKPEDILQNSQKSAQCVIIDPVHLVLQEKK